MFNQLKSRIFLTGLISAISVVLADYLRTVVMGGDMDSNAFIVAGAIAVVGYLGNFLTGIGNTTAGIIGSALVAIIPLIATGHIDWKVVVATIALKLLGLFSDGLAKQETPKQ
jgi:hypothetical protein